MPAKPTAALREPGLREIRIALEPKMDFKNIVALLEDALTVRLPKGCAPCLSGLDRIVIDSTIYEAVNEHARLAQLGNETIRV
jgi:hypothetical protein